MIFESSGNTKKLYSLDWHYGNIQIRDGNAANFVTHTYYVF